MGEVFWGHGATSILLTHNLILAQTFTPLWSHTMERIRWDIKSPNAPCIVKVAIQYLKPDGTPTGDDLVSLERRYFTLDPLAGFFMQQEPIPPLRVIAGTQYAFLIQAIWITGIWYPETTAVPPPGPYPRGKLIVSNDNGTTWDTSDHGDLMFGEYGDPPLNPSLYNPPSQNWAITEVSQNDFKATACVRVATTEPCTLRLHMTQSKPTPIETYQPTRGAYVLCLEHYNFNSYYYFDQKENWDSLYHTFYITALDEGQKYWFTFTGEANFIPGISRSPIFERTHPEAPPFTTIRRPDAPGDVRRLAKWGSAPCLSNYCYVMEATPDEWETCVYNPFPYTKWWEDLYNIPDLLPSANAPIKQVHLTGRFAYKGRYSYASGAYLSIRTHGHTYRSIRFGYFGTTFSNRHWHLYSNPYTGLPWTKAEVDYLQIGIRLYCYEGVGWVTETWCTQLYCKIYHKCEAYN